MNVPSNERVMCPRQRCQFSLRMLLFSVTVVAVLLPLLVPYVESLHEWFVSCQRRQHIRAMMRKIDASGIPVPSEVVIHSLPSEDEWREIRRKEPVHIED